MEAAKKSTTQPWYKFTSVQACDELGVDPASGLSSDMVAKRIATYGPNKLAEQPPDPAWKQFLRQYRDLMQLVLLGVAAISIVALGDWATGILVGALTVFNAFLGMNQEGKAAESVAALRKMLVMKSKVRRNGEIVELSAEELVPGDIVTFEAGDKVPADGRLLEAAALQIEEAGLTGESAPVDKEITAIAADDVPLGDRVNMAFMNTTVSHGRGAMLVTSTGMETQMGQISGMLGGVEQEKTPLAKQLDQLTIIITIAAAAALVLVVAIGLFRDQSFEEMFLLGISLAIASIPSGLPAVVTTLLSMGTQDLATKGAIVKRLKSVETLGATSAICSDKTGTLTLNQMTAREMVIPGRKFSIDGEGYSTSGNILRTAGEGETDFEEVLMPMALCSDAVVSNGEIVGDPTEAALVVLAAKGGIDATTTRQRYPRIAEIPFDSAYKFMATFHNVTDAAGNRIVRCNVKGAPDVVLSRSATGRLPDGRLASLDDYRDTVMAENDRLARGGLRVMAVAVRDIPESQFDPSADLFKWVDDMQIIALVGIVDPARKEAKDAIALCHEAGIRIRMITGDYATTAAAIAAQLDIEGEAITGAEFAAMSDDEVQRRLPDIGVVARVAPEDKVRLVDMLKKQGHVVAMTGDGVNDAPALKRADIGVAMGITGTEVTKEAAEMILTDDNFATIVKAVEGGRALYDNLMKYVRYQVAVLVAFIALFVLAGILNIAEGIPLSPLQILWINFAIDVPLSIGLGFDTASPGLMKRRPRPADASVLTRPVAIRLIIGGLAMAIATLAVVAYGEDNYDLLVALTMGVVTLSLIHAVGAITTRDPERTALSPAALINRRFVYMCLLVVVLTVLVTELGFLQRIFDTTSLTIEQWGICLLATGIVLVFFEVAKFFLNRTGLLAIGPEAQRAPAVTGAAVVEPAAIS
ncbi:MAG TPA: HAD-IC family P-type ATPase [Thermomicrobiales bacterium]|nr:HAD-IC family P-type ATPase [Thermomicrobiales bacterium]